MKATKIAVASEFDEFFSLNIFFNEENPPISIMICRDTSDDYDTVVYTESLDKLYCIYTNSAELSYQFQGTELSFILSLDSPYYFYNNNDKQQIIELAINDVPKVKTILEAIFVNCPTA